MSVHLKNKSLSGVSIWRLSCWTKCVVISYMCLPQILNQVETSHGFLWREPFAMLTSGSAYVITAPLFFFFFKWSWSGNSCITLIVKSELKIFAFPWYNWLIHISPFYLIHSAFPTFSKKNSLKRSKLVWKIYSKCIGPLSCPMFFMLLFLFPPCLPPFRTLISHNNVLKWCGTSLIFLMMEHLILPACYVRSAWIFS